MSRNHASKQEAINQLYDTVKSKFEQDGVLGEIRCLLQSKMVAMMKGKNEASSPLVTRTMMGSGDVLRDSRMQLLNQLIMEYFHWHGFHYTAEMFATETGSENVRPSRETLESALGEFEHRNVPILLELVADIVENKNNVKNV